MRVDVSALARRREAVLVLSTWVVVAIAAVLAFTVPRIGVPVIRSGFNPSTVSLGAGHEVAQTFRVRVGALDALSVDIVDASPGLTLDLEIARRRGADLQVLHREARVADSGWMTIRFAPIETDAAAEYVLQIRPRGAGSSARVTLKTTEGHAYQDGRLSMDGSDLPTDLVMVGDGPRARPWDALAGLLRANSGWPGLEWMLAAIYFGALWAIIRALASAEA